MKNKFLSAAILALAIPAGACSSDSPTMVEEMDIVETAVAAGSFTTLATALEAAGLDDDLQAAGPFTVLAPTDAAFAKLPAGTLESLLNDIPTLRSILLYHVIDGEVPASQVVTLNSAPTLNGQSVSITVSGGTVMVNNATVTDTDIGASNGLIHVIDTVLLPQ